jgi:hypothetical protein
MLSSTIRKATCAAALSLVGLLAAEASAADLLQKGNHLRVKFDKDIPEEIELFGGGAAGPGHIIVVINSEFMGMYFGVEHISISGSPQDDILRIGDSVLILGNLTVKSGAGDDHVYLSGFYGKNAKVSLGTGDDLLWEQDNDLIVVGSYTIKAGAGDDWIDIRQDIAIGGKMSIDLGRGDPAGNTIVSMIDHRVEIAKTLSIRLSREGDQDVLLEDVTAAKLVVRGGKGENEVDLRPGLNLFDETSTKKVEAVLLP